MMTIFKIKKNYIYINMNNERFEKRISFIPLISSINGIENFTFYTHILFIYPIHEIIIDNDNEIVQLKDISINQLNMNVSYTTNQFSVPVKNYDQFCAKLLFRFFNIFTNINYY